MEGFLQRSRCGYIYAALIVLCMGVSVTKVSEGAAADLSSCPDALTKLLPCLPYSQGTSQVPTKDCCTNLESVHEKTPQCLCALIAASVNGTEGVPKMNTTLSLSLGPACKVATKPSVCPDLLGLSPTDPLTKIFTAGSPTSTASNTTTSPATAGPTVANATAGTNASSPENASSSLTSSLLATFLLALAALTVFF